ncbi:MAG: serine/threonine-protein kinase [Pseudomonadota bacterium]
MNVIDDLKTGGALDCLPSQTDLLARALNGRVLNGYRVAGVLGVGGMGVVMRAERVAEDFERSAAIKVLPGPASEELKRRFSVERRVLAELDHPAIARLYDAGETEEGWPYLIMEFVDGEPLDQYCERCSLSIEEKTRLIADVVEAIRFAHARLIVHRDIKLSNVMVRGDGQVKLLDFGIAKLLENDNERLTEAGRVMTPKFASPEQLLGLEVTVATDIYQLGVLSLTLLSKTFSEQESSLDQLIRHAVEETPVPLPDDARRSLPRDLAAIIERCLEVDPARRYPDSGLLATDLSNFLGGRAVSARRATAPQRLVRAVRRSPVISSLVLTTVLAIALGVTGSLRFAFEASRNAERAEFFLARAERNLEMQAALTETLNRVVGDDDLETPTRERLLQMAADAHSDYRKDPQVAATTVLSIGTSFTKRGIQNLAVAVLEPWIEVGYGDPYTVREGKRQLASALRFTETDRAITMVRDLVTEYEGTLDELSIGHLEASNWYALWTNDRTDLNRARDLLRAALDRDDSAEMLSYAWFYIARISNRLKEFEVAYDAVRRAYEVDQTVKVNDMTSRVATRTLLAFFEFNLRGNLNLARALLDANLQDTTDLGNEPLLANTYLLLGDLANEQREFVTAASFYDKWRTLQPTVYPGMPSYTGGMLLMHLRRGEFETAEMIFNEILAASPQGFLEGFNAPNSLVLMKALLVAYRDGPELASAMLLDHGLTKAAGQADLRIAAGIRILNELGVAVPDELPPQI